MRKDFRFLLPLIGLILLGCGKGDPPVSPTATSTGSGSTSSSSGPSSTPTVQGTAKITGMISPAGAVTVELLNLTNQQTSRVSPDSTSGKFSFEGLNGGTYLISYVSNFPYYFSRKNIPVNVYNGAALDLGTVSFTRQMQKTLTFNIDGAGYDMSALAEFTPRSSTMYIHGSLGCANNPDLGESCTPANSFYLYLDNVTGPGTYQIKATTTSQMRVGHFIAGSETALGDGSGIVIIKSIDTSGKTISGTFSSNMLQQRTVSLNPPSFTTKQVQLTQGVFDFRY